MTVKQAVVIIAVGLALLLGGLWVNAKIHERHGSGNTEVAAGKAQEKAAVVQLAHYDTVFVRDTVRLARAVTRYDTLKTTERVTDTVWVRQFIVAADSVKKACTDAILSCEQKDSAHRIIEAGLRLQNEGLRKELPTRTEKVLTAGKWLLIGAAIEAVGSRAHR